MANQNTPHLDLGGYVLGVLQPEEATAFEAHLAGCPECRRDLEELAGVSALLGQAPLAIDVPPGLRERTFAAIERAAEETPVHMGRRRRRRRTVELRQVVAAAAAMLAIGVGSVVVREATQPAPATAQIVELTAPAGGAARAVATVRATDTGGVIEMKVEGLTPPPSGFFFECWLVAAEGDSVDRPRRISVGTFNVDKGGRAIVRWDFTADVTKFPRMGITLEPDDGNPVHTTDRVLAGTRPLHPVAR